MQAYTLGLRGKPVIHIEDNDPTSNSHVSKEARVPCNEEYSTINLFHGRSQKRLDTQSSISMHAIIKVINTYFWRILKNTNMSAVNAIAPPPCAQMRQAWCPLSSRAYTKKGNTGKKCCFCSHIAYIFSLQCVLDIYGETKWIWLYIEYDTLKIQRH